MESGKLFSTQELATELSLSTGMIRQWIASGDAYPLRKVGNGWLFTAEEVERLRAKPRGKPGRQRKTKQE
jgi:hypothetical protein